MLQHVNLISGTVVFLQALVDDVRHGNFVELTKTTIETLIELCVGNTPNQQTAVDAQLIDALNQLLNTTEVHVCM